MTWDQNMAKGHLSTALNLCKTVARLHGHISPGQANTIDELSEQLDVMVGCVTQSQFRSNIRHFYEVMDEVWGIRNVHYRDLARYMSGGFTETLARILSNHSVFWRGVNEQNLVVEAQWRKKLKSFPINDPNVIPIASAAGSSRIILYQLMIEHLNSGKRTHRLSSRRVLAKETQSKKAEAA